MDEKKKIAIIAVLAVVMVGIGAFQFMKPGPTPPVAAKTEEPKVEGAATPTENKEAVKNVMAAAALSQRDPFQSAAWATVRTPSQTPEPAPMPIQPDKFGGGQNGFAPALPPVGPGGEMQLTPAEPQFAYALTGLILGEKPAAVFQDAGGGQRLVTLGGSLDGDSKVVDIQKGEVTVRMGNKTLKLTLGGNSSAK